MNNNLKMYYVSLNEEMEYNFTVLARDENKAIEVVNEYINTLLSRTTYWRKWNLTVDPVVYYSCDLAEEIISSPVKFYTGELYREKYERENWWKFWKR